MNTLFIRKATGEDVPRVWIILQQAVEQMLREGKRQWSRNYPRPEHIEEDIEKESGTFCQTDGTVIAYAAVVYTGEPATMHWKAMVGQCMSSCTGSQLQTNASGRVSRLDSCR